MNIEWDNNNRLQNVPTFNKSKHHTNNNLRNRYIYCNVLPHLMNKGVTICDCSVKRESSIPCDNRSRKVFRQLMRAARCPRNVTGTASVQPQISPRPPAFDGPFQLPIPTHPHSPQQILRYTVKCARLRDVCTVDYGNMLYKQTFDILSNICIGIRNVRVWSMP